MAGVASEELPPAWEFTIPGASASALAAGPDGSAWFAFSYDEPVTWLGAELVPVGDWDSVVARVVDGRVVVSAPLSTRGMTSVRALNPRPDGTVRALVRVSSPHRKDTLGGVPITDGTWLVDIGTDGSISPPVLIRGWFRGMSDDATADGGFMVSGVCHQDRARCPWFVMRVDPGGGVAWRTDLRDLDVLPLAIADRPDGSVYVVGTELGDAGEWPPAVALIVRPSGVVETLAAPKLLGGYIVSDFYDVAVLPDGGAWLIGLLRIETPSSSRRGTLEFAVHLDAQGKFGPWFLGDYDPVWVDPLIAPWGDGAITGLACANPSAWYGIAKGFLCVLDREGAPVRGVVLPRELMDLASADGRAFVSGTDRVYRDPERYEDLTYTAWFAAYDLR